jgi:uncharacterized pyridoxamine 5'-phosphate oxidase family protein
MSEVLTFLKDNPTFYLATVDGDIPKVRPFGFVLEFEGKLYFATSNTKNVYKQLRANPHFEIAAASKTGEWLRLKGKAVFNTTRQLKQAALDAAPFLKDIYSVDDSVFELFYIDDGEATFSDLKGSSRTVKL